MFGVTGWRVGDLLVSNCGYLWVCFDLGLLICWVWFVWYRFLAACWTGGFGGMFVD